MTSPHLTILTCALALRDRPIPANSIGDGKFRFLSSIATEVSATHAARSRQRSHQAFCRTSWTDSISLTSATVASPKVRLTMSRYLGLSK